MYFVCMFAFVSCLSILSTEAKKTQLHGRKRVDNKPHEKMITYGLPFSLSANLTTDNYIEYISKMNCKNEKPFCTGKDCELVPDAKGCLSCNCPAGSKARGCDKMPKELYTDLWINGCPMIVNHKMMRTPPQEMTRFYRHIDQANGIDECRNYTAPFYPFCQFLGDNLWNSPETVDECKDLCFARNPPTSEASNTTSLLF